MNCFQSEIFKLRKGLCHELVLQTKQLPYIFLFTIYKHITAEGGEEFVRNHYRCGVTTLHKLVSVLIFSIFNNCTAYTV